MLRILVLLFSILLFSGCATVISEEEQSELQRNMAKEQKMGEDMLEAFRKKDFDGYTRYIPAGGKQVYTKKQFCLAFPSIFTERKQGKVDEYSGSNLLSIPNSINKNYGF